MRKWAGRFLWLPLLIGVALPVGASNATGGRDIASGPIGASLVMVLRSGPHFPAPLPPVTPAPDIPQVDPAIQLPLYPGAVNAGRLPNHLPGFAITLSPYSKSAWAEYWLPVDAAMAMIWYRGQFLGAGFVLVRTSYGGGPGYRTSEWAFTSRANPSLSAQISFEAITGKDVGTPTVMFYYAEDEMKPSSQPYNYLAGVFKAVRLTYRPGGVGKGQPVVRTFTNPGIVSRLQLAIDTLSPTGAYCSLPARATPNATLVFVRQNGDTVPVSARPACHTVIVPGFVDFQDRGQAIWQQIAALATGRAQ